MVRGRRTPPEKKARAAAEILTGATVPQAATAAEVSERTAARIKAELAEDGSLKTYNYAALVGEHLAANIEARTVHVRLFGDVAWLERQPADKIQALAVLYGVLDDKAFRILAALRRPDADRGLNAAIDGAAERVE